MLAADYGEIAPPEDIYVPEVLIENDAIDALIAERQGARAAKDFATADRIRDELLSAGIELEDTPTGPRWRRAR